MKKITLLIAATIFALSVNAQLFNIAGVDVGYINVGPKLGVNASFNSMDANAGTEKKANYGYEFGGVAKFGITKKLAIQPEIIFSSKGVIHDGGTFKSIQNTRYFGIPIIAQYAFTSIYGVQVYGSGGFYTDFLLGIKHVDKIDGQPDIVQKTTDFTNINRVDFGLNFGGGANIPFKNNDILNVDLRLGFGLTNVVDANIVSSSRNTSIQLSAIYLVDLTKWVNFRGKSSKTTEPNITPASESKVN